MGAAQTVGDPRFVEPVPYRMTTHERLVFALAMVVSLAGMAIAVLAFQHFDGLRERGLERDAWASLAIWTTLSSIMVFGALPLSLWPRIRRERARLAACPTVSGRIIELKVPSAARVAIQANGSCGVHRRRRVIHAADRYPISPFAAELWATWWTCGTTRATRAGSWSVRSVGCVCSVFA